MKKSRLILLILLAVLLIVYIILRFNNSQERTRKIFGNMVKNVEKIHIWNDEGSIKLVLTDGKWLFADNTNWEADSLRITNFFADVLEAEYATTPMSSGEDAIQRYQLQDSEALHVSIQSPDQERHVLFSNIGNVWDYFRFDGEDEVYQIRSKVVQQYQPTVINWRSPLVVHYWEEEIKEIRVEYPSNNYTLYRLGTEWFYRDAKENFMLDFNNYALVKIISLLQNFRSFVFMPGDDEETMKKFETPMVTVWITDIEDNVQKLSFASFDNARHMMMIDDDNSIIYQVGFDSIYRFMRPAEIFKRKSA
nr:hypothetical protein [Candidatus Cloacimonadota bacterium]